MFCRCDLQRQVRILEVLVEGRRRPQLIWITLQMLLKMGCILKHIYIYIYIQTHIYVYIYTYLYVHIYIYVYLFIIYWLSVYIIYWGILMGKMIINRTARVKLSMRDEDPLAGAPWMVILGSHCIIQLFFGNQFGDLLYHTYVYRYRYGYGYMDI